MLTLNVSNGLFLLSHAGKIVKSKGDSKLTMKIIIFKASVRKNFPKVNGFRA